MTVNTGVDQDKLDALLGKMVEDIGATISAPLMVIGDRLGLYRALAEGGPQTPAQLAERTGTRARYVAPWLVNQAARGYAEYDPSSGRYSLTPEQALVFVEEEDSPAFVVGGMETMVAASMAVDRVAEAFRTGGGMAWGEHHPGLFRGTERFFRPGYLANLATSWIPAIEGVVRRLESGGQVADVGCGHGASTIIIAEAYPNARLVGSDFHAESIEQARGRAEKAGVADRVSFEVAAASKIPGVEGGYDLVTYFDCLHDMGDPLGALRRARAVLAEGGVVMIVEPMAGERVEENFNPIGRAYSAGSAMICTPNAVATGGNGLGTIATEAEIRAVAEAAGFRRFRRATETSLNRIFEARP
jgi:SAM-dependent methyltransferase